MKVVFAVWGLGYGGAGKMLAFVANSFAELGHKCSIAVFERGEVTQELNKNISVHNFEQRNAKFSRRISQYFSFKKFIKTEKPDLIISFTSLPNFFATLVGRQTKTKVIISERCDPVRNKENILSKMIFYIVNKADGAVFQLEEAKNHYKKKLQKKAVVIPNPIFTKNILHREKIEKTIVNVARVEIEQKRQDVLLNAFKLVLQKYPDYTLKLYGDGGDLEKTQKMAVDLELESSVFFMGYVPNIQSEIRNAEIFALTSDYEGIPNALLEAMAIGLPCVSTDCSPGGARFLIKDGENGLLVPCGDENVLANAIIRFIENKELASNCGENAKKVLIEFDPKVVSQLWVSYATSIVKGETK